MSRIYLERCFLPVNHSLCCSGTFFCQWATVSTARTPSFTSELQFLLLGRLFLPVNRSVATWTIFFTNEHPLLSPWYFHFFPQPLSVVSFLAELPKSDNAWDGRRDVNHPPRQAALESKIHQQTRRYGSFRQRRASGYQAASGRKLKLEIKVYCGDSEKLAEPGQKTGRSWSLENTTLLIWQ